MTTLVLGFWIVVLAAISYYLFVNLRRLWRSAKRLGREAARLAEAPGKAASRHPAREPDGPTPAPFHDFRRRQAEEDHARIRNERRQRRQERLERARARWDAAEESSYARFDRAKARADYDEYMTDRRQREEGAHE